MAARRTNDDSSSKRTRPATTPEGRENQLISLAVDLVERKLREGTASSQEVTHFLKLASSRERLEQQRLEGEIEILAAKKEMLDSAKRVEELYGKALKAMRNYSGQGDGDEDDEDDYGR